MAKMHQPITQKLISSRLSSTTSCFLLLLAIQVETGCTMYVIRYLQVAHCPASMNHSTDLLNYSMFLDMNGNELLTATFNLTKPLQTIPSMVAIVQRCRDLVSVHTCEHFTRLTWKLPVCPLLPVKNAIWTPVVEFWRPRMICPLRQGIFTGKDMSFDIDLMYRSIGIRDASGIWGFRGYFNDENNKVAVCCDVYTKVIKIHRKH